MSKTLRQSIGAPGFGAAAQRITGYPASSNRFDWLNAIFVWWIMAGLFTDGWAHNNLDIPVDTFFTPWHGLLYSGLAVKGTFLLIAYIRNLRRGYAWNQALPVGYMQSLVGAGLFVIGGALDFIWHETAGFEAGVEALLSPPHLILATGGILLTTGALRSVWMRDPAQRKVSWRELLPALLSLLATLSIFTFFTQFSNGFQHANLFTGAPPARPSYYHDATGISYVIIPAALIMGFILFTMQRWSLPAGSLTLLIAGNAGLMFVMGTSYNTETAPVLLAALVGGVIADVLYSLLKPSADRVGALRVFAFAIPFILFMLYFGILILTSGIWWSIHMWLGAPFVAGVVGLLLSFLVRPLGYTGTPAPTPE